MDSWEHHGISCRCSAGRFPHHAALNDIIKRSLQTAGLPSLLEPVGLDRGDGKRPDGIDHCPFKRGKSLCWDCTCVDTFAESNLIRSAILAGTAANDAETRQRGNYPILSDCALFEPLAIDVCYFSSSALLYYFFATLYIFLYILWTSAYNS